MLRKLKRKFKFYRQYELDIWGIYTVTPIFNKNKKLNKYQKYFIDLHNEKKHRRYLRVKRYIYRIDLRDPLRKIKRKKKKFISKKLIGYFYLTLKESRYRRIASVARRKEGSWQSNFMYMIECRLVNILYRMQFLLNVFEAKHFVLSRNVIVNNKLKTYLNMHFAYADKIRVKYSVEESIRAKILRRFIKNYIYFNTPRYLLVSYRLMFAAIVGNARADEVAYPLRVLDVFRGADIN